MADYLSRLVERAAGHARLVRPRSEPVFSTPIETTPEPMGDAAGTIPQATAAGTTVAAASAAAVSDPRPRLEEPTVTARGVGDAVRQGEPLGNAPTAPAPTAAPATLVSPAPATEPRPTAAAVATATPVAHAPPPLDRAAETAAAAAGATPAEARASDAFDAEPAGPHSDPMRPARSRIDGDDRRPPPLPAAVGNARTADPERPAPPPPPGVALPPSRPGDDPEPIELPTTAASPRSAPPIVAPRGPRERPPDVHVKIGRVEIKSAPPPPTPPRAKSTRAAPMRSLADYLRKREGRA